MSNDSFVIRQPAGQRTLALRESYLAICGNDACEAQLLNALERWYAYKLKMRDESRGRNKAATQSGEEPGADESLWVRMSASQWATTELMALYNEKTVRTKLGKLVERGFILTRSHPKLKWDRTPQWLFNRSAVQDAVDLWEQQREQPDLNPSPADDTEIGDSTQSEIATNSVRTNVRMEPDKTPSQAGQNSESIRENVRSNNTGILTQESSTGILTQKESSSKSAEIDEDSSWLPDDDERSAEAEPPKPTLTISHHPVQDQTQLADTKLKPVTDLEHVPGAAGGAAGGAVSAILALLPVPRAELEARQPREASSMKTLRALMQATSDKRLDHLHEQLRQNTQGKRAAPRSLLARLTDAEIEQARKAAQADAGLVKGGMASAGYYALDTMIGERFSLARLKGEAELALAVTPNGQSLQTVQEQREVQQALPPVEAGSQWLSRKSGAAYTVHENLDGMITVEGLDGEYGLARFHKIFRPAAEASA